MHVFHTKDLPYYCASTYRLIRYSDINWYDGYIYIIWYNIEAPVFFLSSSTVHDGTVNVFATWRARVHEGVAEASQGVRLFGALQGHLFQRHTWVVWTMADSCGKKNNGAVDLLLNLWPYCIILYIGCRLVDICRCTYANTSVVQLFCSMFSIFQYCCAICSIDVYG